MDIEEALSYLDRHLNREARAGRYEGLSLDVIRSLLHAMADPHKAYPSVHVTGTNGKGSVCTMIASLLEAHGLSTGLYTSPHLHRPNERIAHRLRPISDVQLARAIEDVAVVEPLVDGEPSWFELMTAAAFGCFADLGVDVAVVEVGLLGRFDATNVLESPVAVLTNIGKDHTDGVGDWRRAIAEEKSGIVHPGARFVCGETDPSLRSVFDATPAERRVYLGEDFRLTRNDLAVGGRLVSVKTPRGEVEDVFLPLHGRHQGVNFAIALAAVEEFFDRPLDQRTVEDACELVSIPGRFEVVSRRPLVVLDGAHNPEAAASVRETLKDFGWARRTFVIGFLEGRDPREVMGSFGIQPGDRLIICPPPSPRAMEARRMVLAAQQLGLDPDVEEDPATAVGRALDESDEEDAVVVTGSLYLVGAVRTALVEPDDEDTSLTRAHEVPPVAE
ncbi:MAG: dihydrofolate synthase [Acidimicrobiales bacterium]|nr:MAG: dihydrofolate synthase [Acidimicrobiales bacterium]